jgi:hypothetical protein
MGVEPKKPTTKRDPGGKRARWWDFYLIASFITACK